VISVHIFLVLLEVGTEELPVFRAFNCMLHFAACD